MADGPEVAIRRLIKRQIAIAGLVCVVTLVGATLMCRAFSTHEMVSWGAGGGSFIHALAFGVCLSGLVFIGSLVVLVAGIFELLSSNWRKQE